MHVCVQLCWGIILQTFHVVFPVAPAIIVGPNVTDPFTEGDTMAVACTATGRPYPTIQWYKDGVLLVNESLIMIYNEVVEQNGLLSTTSILEVYSVGADDHGSYRCVASNSAGNDSFDFDIYVTPGMYMQLSMH